MEATNKIGVYRQSIESLASLLLHPTDLFFFT